jgi:hypothetical protein
MKTIIIKVTVGVKIDETTLKEEAVDVGTEDGTGAPDRKVTGRSMN